MFLVLLSHFKDSEIVHTPILLEEEPKRERILAAIRRSLHGTANIEEPKTGIGVYVLPNNRIILPIPKDTLRIYHLHTSPKGWVEEWRTGKRLHRHNLPRLPRHISLTLPKKQWCVHVPPKYRKGPHMYVILIHRVGSEGPTVGVAFMTGVPNTSSREIF